MNFEFDPAKDAANQEKHGISLEKAAYLVWEEANITEDRRGAYGEARMVAVAPIGSRLYVVVYTDRPPQRRIISLRKANAREVKRYVSQN
jgi:uncharacterized protein